MIKKIAITTAIVLGVVAVQLKNKRRTESTLELERRINR